MNSCAAAEGRLAHIQRFWWWPSSTAKCRGSRGHRPLQRQQRTRYLGTNLGTRLCETCPNGCNQAQPIGPRTHTELHKWETVGTAKRSISV